MLLARSLTLFVSKRLAGHAKWQNIKGTKMSNDLAKGKLVSRYVQLVRKAIVSNAMITDPKLNSKLAGVLAEATKLNVPKATLERAIVRTANVKFVPIDIEAQHTAGWSLVIKCETENKSNLRRELKKILKKYDISLVTEDSLINMFRQQGIIRTPNKFIDGRELTQDLAEEAAIVANIEEVAYDEDNEQFVYTTSADLVNSARGELSKMGIDIISSDVELTPFREVDFGPETSEKVAEVLVVLREHEQVVDVYHNVLMRD